MKLAEKVLSIHESDPDGNALFASFKKWEDGWTKAGKHSATKSLGDGKTAHVKMDKAIIYANEKNSRLRNPMKTKHVAYIEVVIKKEGTWGNHSVPKYFMSKSFIGEQKYDAWLEHVRKIEDFLEKIIK